MSDIFPVISTPVSVLGLMSGTSGDGIDAALVRFEPDGAFRLLRYEAYPFDFRVRTRLQGLMQRASADEVALAAGYVAELYARAVEAFRAHGPGDERIDLLAAHGQTLAHRPAPENWEGIPVRGTLQALNSGWLAHKTGIPVAYDFRSRDLAADGEGAPLVPYGDRRFFGGLPGDSVCLNIGGIANITVLRRTPLPTVVAAFDTGPGNMLMDALAIELSGGQNSYDAEGLFAARGTTHPDWLKTLMSDVYLHRPPPKSTGRDRFGRDRLAEFRASIGKDVNLFDLMSTLLDFTVCSIVDALERFVFSENPIQRVILAGGGAENSELVRRLRIGLPASTQLSRSDVFGVPAGAREAMAFAALGEALLRGIPGNVPAATGATSEVILGSLTPP
ncbi:MAG: anhydro-N-acetylmuramic acid kinase [Candidatus Riflebacteria bacterium]|nr:anhydro-N-acetylmuramic acid kinase [Candidatus Riflebacteria bacterium]